MQKQFLYLEGRKLSYVLKLITRRDAKLAGRIRKMCGQVIEVVALVALAVLLAPSIAKAQDDHSLNSNTHAPTMNSGHADAFAPAAGAGANGAVASATEGKNDGSYVPSNFVNYKDALKAGKDAVAAPPKTLAEVARENREKKAAEAKKAGIVIDENGNIVKPKAPAPKK